MLLLVLSLFSNYAVFHCYQAGHVPANSSDSRLSDVMHQSIHEMDALLRDFQQEIQKDQAVLKAVDHEFKEVLPDLHITGVENPGHSVELSPSPSIPETPPIPYTTPIPFPKFTFRVAPRTRPEPGTNSIGLNAVTATHSPEPRFSTQLPRPSLKGRTRLTTVNRISPMRAHQPARLGRTLSQAQLWVRNKQWMKTNKAGRTRQGNIEKGLRVPDENLAPNLPGPDENPLAKEPGAEENLVANPPGSDENKPAEPRTGQSFSVPALTDITPAMMIPGLEQVSAVAEAQEITEPTVIQDPMFLTANEAGLITETAFMEELFKEDDQGFLYISSPATIINTMESTSNTIGQVLMNAEAYTATTQSTTLTFQKLMDEHDEGYMVVFLIELCRLIAQKPPEDVGPVIREFEIFYNKQYEQGALQLFGEHISDVGMLVSRFCTSPINYVQIYANMMQKLLEDREESLSVEMNSIIDYADLLYEDDEGKELFAALKEFQLYPNGTSDGLAVCQHLFEAFKQPYRRLTGSERLKKLLDSLTAVIIKKSYWRRAGDLRVGLAITERYQRRKKKKQKLRSLRQRIETKRYRWQRPRQQDRNQDIDRRQINLANEIPMLRSMLPITKHQKRFRVITPRDLRTNGYLNMERPTVDYFRKRLGRPVHPPNGKLHLFPHAREVDYRRRAQLTDEEKQHLEESAKHQTLGKMRDEVRRIVEDSSYSDEESSLRMNLRPALRVNWHGTSTPLSNK